MPDVQEVFRMATQKVRPDPGALDRQISEQRTRTVRRKAGAFALVAVLAVAVAVIAYDVTSGEDRSDTGVPPGRPESGVVLIDVETGDLSRLVDQDDISHSDVSPDGSMIAMTGEVEGYAQIFLMNRDGTQRRQLTEARFGAADPDWSPDGSALVYQSLFEGDEESDWDIWTVDLSSGITEQLTDEPGEAFGASWSPDGTSILYTVGRSSAKSVLRIVDHGTGEITQLTRKGEAAAEGSWSPDGTTIVYSSDAVGGGPDGDGHESHGIWLMDADGSNKREIVSTNAALFRPRFSPDGTRIAYFVEDEGGCCDTYVLDLETGVSQKVAEGTLFATWLDDDTLIATL